MSESIQPVKIREWHNVISGGFSGSGRFSRVRFLIDGETLPIVTADYKGETVPVWSEQVPNDTTEHDWQKGE